MLIAVLVLLTGVRFLIYRGLADTSVYYMTVAELKTRPWGGYRRAYKLDPSHGSSLLNMALLYSRNKGDNAKALELLQQRLRSNPEPQLGATAQQEITRIKQAAGTSPSNN